MNKFFLVFFGGGLGSVTRYGLSAWINKFSQSNFPLSTFTINCFASFILGLLAGFIAFKEGDFETQRLLIGVGFCGGLSTFSTFTLETFDLIKTGNILIALSYILASVIVCLIAFWLAHFILKTT